MGWIVLYFRHRKRFRPGESAQMDMICYGGDSMTVEQKLDRLIEMLAHMNEQMIMRR